MENLFSDRFEKDCEEIRRDWRVMRQAAGNDPSLEFPIGWRVRLVWKLSGKSLVNFARAIDGNHRTLEKNIRSEDPADITKPELFANIVAYMTREFPQLNKEVTSETFCTYKLLADNAVDQFVSWLRGGAIGPVTNTDLLTVSGGPLLFSAQSDKERAENAKDKHSREGVFGDILKFLADDKHQLQNIMVVHQPGMAIGLTALAAEICEECRHGVPKGKPVCYLPLARQLDGHRVSFASLIARLKAFYLQKSLLQAAPTTSNRELRSDIEFIREQMMSYPAIILLDGHRALTSPVPNLDAAILDDPVTMLLREIAYPLAGKADGSGSMSTYYRSRILIFSDRLPTTFSRLPMREAEFPPPPDDRIGELLSNQKRENQPAILSVCAGSEELRKDAALDILEALFSLRKKNKKSGHASLIKDLSTEGFKGAITHLLKELRSNPLALAVLRLVCLTHDGMRIGTLQRMLQDLAALPDPSGILKEWQVKGKVTIKAIEAAVGELGRLVRQGPDEEFPGLDDDSDAGFGLPRLASPLEKATAIIYVDAGTAELREEILSDLSDSPALPLLHRLVAEEALQQHTIIMRHSDWGDMRSARFYRRLLQGIYHGFLSLSDGPTSSFSGFDRVRHILPTDNREAYRRIYSVLFRVFLDSPPHFELARVFGREAVKADLILMATQIGRRNSFWFSKTKATYAPWAEHSLVSPFLSPQVAGERAASQHEQVAANGAADRQLAFDQLLSLARCYYQMHNLERASTVLEVGKQKLGPYQENESDEIFKHRLGIAKTAADIEILRYALSTNKVDQEKIRAALVRAGFAKSALKQLDEMEKRSGGANASKTLADLDSKALAWAKGQSSTKLAAWSDLLCRLYEIPALEADAGQSKADSVRKFYKAFVGFYMAERLRRAAFEALPIGREYAVNGHSTRVFTRVILQLVKCRDKGSPGSAQLPSRDYLVNLARRHIDILTRYFSRYPSERPSLLLLEAQFVRIAGWIQPEERKQALAVALRLISRAELMMWGAADRPRVQFRLLLERIKVLRELGLEMSKSGNSGVPSKKNKKFQKILETAYYDAGLLIQLTKRAKVTLWGKLALDAMSSLTKAFGPNEYSA